MATFISSEKNKRKLCDEENYIYEKHADNSRETKIYWRCEHFYKGCRARIHTTFNLFISVLYKSNFLTSVMVEFSMVEFSVVEFTYGGIFHGGIFRGGIFRGGIYLEPRL